YTSTTTYYYTAPYHTQASHSNCTRYHPKMATTPKQPVLQKASAWTLPRFPVPCIATVYFVGIFIPSSQTARWLKASRFAVQLKTSSITRPTSSSVSSGYTGSDRTLAADFSVTGSAVTRAGRPHGNPSC